MLTVRTRDVRVNLNPFPSAGEYESHSGKTRLLVEAASYQCGLCPSPSPLRSCRTFPKRVSPTLTGLYTQSEATCMCALTRTQCGYTHPQVCGVSVVF
jgi:hypothetical protein